MGKPKRKKKSTALAPAGELATCGAKSKTSGKPCKLQAGHGTPHLGEGRCKFHGGLSPGGPPGNRKGQKHGLFNREFLGYFTKAKKAAMQTIRRAEAATDPLKAQDAANILQADAQRLLAGVLLVERRCADLEAQGKLDDKAQAASHRVLIDYERLLSKVRAAQVNLLNSFGTGGDEDQEITVHLAIPEGVHTLKLAAGVRMELDGDVDQAPVLPAPVVEVEKLER